MEHSAEKVNKGAPKDPTKGPLKEAFMKLETPKREEIKKAFADAEKKYW